METGVTLFIVLMFCAVIFLVFAIIFAVKKEKACVLIGGFNFFTPAQQAQYDKKRIAQDYKKLFFVLTAVMAVGAVLSLFLHYWAFGAAMAAMLALIGKDFHIYADKAFEKYKL